MNSATGDGVKRNGRPPSHRSREFKPAGKTSDRSIPRKSVIG